MSSVIIFSDVSYDLPNGRTLFKNFNFTINARISALVGPNGIGKTTLAKMIAGEISPSRGSVRTSRAISFFRQRKTPPESTVAEYLLESYSWSILGEKLLDGIDHSLRCSCLSGGQWMRVRLVAALGGQFLVLDEPSNDLDRDSKKLLAEFLREYQEGVLLISHDRELLSLCECVFELSNQGIEKTGSTFDIYELERDQERLRSQSELQIARRERDKAQFQRTAQIERQNKRTQRGKRAGIQSGMAKIQVGSRKRRAQETMGKIDVSTMQQANEKLSMAIVAYDSLKAEPVMYADLMGSRIPNQRVIAEAMDYNITFGQGWLYAKDLNFNWRGNIRLAVNGANGAGKSTLIKALLGKNFESRGRLNIGSCERLYLDQHCTQLDDSKTVLEYVRDLSLLSETEVRNHLAKFHFWGDSVFLKAQDLSGGERLRATLAGGLLSVSKPELLIFDEPTNNLDLKNIKFLEGLISQFQGGVILISHDEAFLKECGIHQVFSV